MGGKSSWPWGDGSIHRVATSPVENRRLRPYPCISAGSSDRQTEARFMFEEEAGKVRRLASQMNLS